MIINRGCRPAASASLGAPVADVSRRCVENSTTRTETRLSCAFPEAPLKAFIVIAALLSASCASAPREVALTPLWTAHGLSNPESVLLSGETGVAYVSNVSGEADAKDGVGFIARIGMDGRMLDADWVAGLDAPKGLALMSGRLFVTDIDQIVEIDTRSATVIARYPAEGAAFLNDAAALPDGTVLASDSGTGRIYSLRDGAMGLWLEDALLRAVNGLHVERDRLVVSTMQGRLLAVDYETRAISVLAEDLGDADGIAPLGDGAYIISEWRGRLFHVAPDGASRVILDTREEGVLLNDILLTGDTLLIPNWEPSTVTAYRVRR